MDLFRYQAGFEAVPYVGAQSEAFKTALALHRLEVEAYRTRRGQ